MTEQEELEYLKQNSPMALPDDPSSSGWSAAQIKEKHYAGLFFLYNLFKANRENLNQAVSDMQEIVDSINAEYDEIINGKNVSAKWDDENNEIKTTYAKILNITNGTIKVLKYIKENGTDDYIYNIEKNLSTLTTNFNTLKAWTDNLKDINSDTSVLRAVQATKDGLGNIINETYATIASLTLVNSSISNIVNGTTIVGKAYNDQLGRRIDTTYIRIADIINALNDTSTNKPLSAAMGKSLQDQINAINTLLASDDTDLDTIQEIITYIKNNKTLIENITSDKMSYSVLVHNLTTNNDNLPLSASMGYALKAMIDAINDAETGIQAAEALRVIAEAGRVEAEEARQTGYSGFDSRITANEDDIEDLQTAVSGLENGKQDVLTFDNTPTANSNNPVKSGGIKTYVDNGVSEAKSYVDKVANDLQWQLGTYNYDVATDSNVARLKTLHANTIKSMVDYIGGKSVKYNQLVQNSNFVDTSNWGIAGGTFSVSNNVGSLVLDGSSAYPGLTSTNNLFVGHKYLITLQFKGNSYLGLNFGGYDGNMASGLDSSIFNNLSVIKECTTARTNFSFYVRRTETPSGTLEFKKIIVIDLTDIFGSGNEPSTVETAIPLLKANGYKLDGTDTYSTGSLKHAITTSVKYLPINVWDEQLELGTLDGDGNIYPSSTQIRSKNFTEIMPSTNYFAYCKNHTDSLYWFAIYWYDSNYNYISKVWACNSQTTSPSNAKYFKISTNASSFVYGNTYNNDICINISNASYNGNYYPYVAPITKAIPSEVLADTRYGLGFDNSNYNHLDSDGHLRGNWGIVDLGSLSYVKVTYNRYYSTDIANIIKHQPAGTVPNALVVGYTVTTGENVAQNLIEYSFAVNTNGNIVLFNTVSYYENNTAEQLKQSLSGKYLLYELNDSFNQDYSQYFDTNWNKVDLDKLYATCEMVVAEPIDMPNSITNLIKEVKA